jgi:ABC-type nitrate/sulfonate/bicarbonate transport system substrate-binding protein
MPLTGYAALASWTKNNTDAAKAFQAAMTKATLIARADSSKVIEVMVDDLHVPREDAQIANLITPGFEASLAADRLRRPAQLLLDVGGLSQMPAVNAMIWTPPSGH